MATTLLRLVAIFLAFSAQTICCQAEEFYVAHKNGVYLTEARQLHLNDPSMLPLALIRVHWGWLLAVFHRDSEKVETLEFGDVCKRVDDSDLRPESVIISEEKLYEKRGPLKFFKEYPTDSYDGAIDVTAVPRGNCIFVTLAPPQKNQFEGSTCIVTDITTKKDVHVAHRISEIDTFDQPVLTWISDQMVLAFEYAYRGNGGYYIDTKNDTRTNAWGAVDHAQYFSFDGKKLTLYVPNGDHFNARVATNFADELEPANSLIASESWHDSQPSAAFNR